MTDFHIILEESSAGKKAFSCASALHYAALAGLRFVGLTIPSDGTNYSSVSTLAAQVRKISLYANVEAWLGVELIHLPPALIPEAVQEARDAGAAFVMVYGESLGDQVEQGTNFAAIEAGADIISHPGLIDEKAVAFAAERGVALELTSCPRHALANAHASSLACRFGAPVIRGSNASAPEELTTRLFWPMVIKGSTMASPNNDMSNLLEYIRKSEENFVRKLMEGTSRR